MRSAARRLTNKRRAEATAVGPKENVCAERRLNEENFFSPPHQTAAAWRADERVSERTSSLICQHVASLNLATRRAPRSHIVAVIRRRRRRRRRRRHARISAVRRPISRSTDASKATIDWNASGAKMQENNNNKAQSRSANDGDRLELASVIELTRRRRAHRVSTVVARRQSCLSDEKAR